MKELWVTLLYFDAKGNELKSVWTEYTTLAIEPGATLRKEPKSTAGRALSGTTR